MSQKSAERILCFPASLLDALGPFQGISTEVERFLPVVTDPANCRHVRRCDAESDESLKQLIPYVIFVSDGSVFRYRRGKRGGEDRLREKYSIGIGGHIAVDDRLLFSADHDRVGYADAMWREVLEEVTIDSPLKETCVGLINDDSNAVGQVHFGVVHMVSLSEPRMQKRESVITDCGFVDLASARGARHSYESWSELCLASLDGLLAKANEAWRAQDWHALGHKTQQPSVQF